MSSDFQHSMHAQDWDGIDRRKRLTTPHDTYEERRATNAPVPPDPNAPITQSYLDQALQDWRHASREYFNTHFIRLEELIRDGFPDGDPSKHREVHQGYIDKAKARSDMWQAVLKQVVTGSVWAAILAIASGLWVVFKAEVKK